MKTEDTKAKIVDSAIALGVTVICTAIALLTPIKTTSMKVIGSYVSVAVISLAAWKFPRRFYILAMIFHFFSASLGSVINLYRYVSFYDKLVHYLSGILLAEAGMIIINYVFEKRLLIHDNAVKLMFSFFFSAACAGFWEIYEFTADRILNAAMQGGNSNTMGDIISGVLGALTYSVMMYRAYRRKRNNGT
ncbi:hypothetical protein [Ruminococcus sp. Marseille-P6503]|uniref:hypothetical protein n=1 Tax=Ruminococcus sp. Marseille-P6503 TaxID=2364796 RepID=UPI000F54363C|nr:hypothetical protein [Ruminococcus sp. Marseille-P6503]